MPPKRDPRTLKVQKEKQASLEGKSVSGRITSG